MKIYAFSILLIVGITGCKQNESTAEKQPVVEKKAVEKKPVVKKYCYVLCDFSGSQDQSSINVISENAEAIFKAARQYDIRYYDITTPDLERAFFRSDPEEDDLIETPSQKRERLSMDTARLDSLSGLITKMRSAPLSGSTCIITSIDKVCRSLAREVSKDDIVKVVILSDMLEDCTYSFGKIDIDHAPFSMALKTLDSMESPKYTFAGYNVELSIIGSSQRSINMAGLDSFWEKVFSRYGLKDKPLIAVDLPRWITN
jgi:hypothetical protein